MTTRLSEELNKDYKPERNSFAFYTKRSNKRLTLNQLAAEMSAWAAANNVSDGGIEASRLSLVVNGKDRALFTIPQLRVYCSVMEMTQVRGQELLNVLAHDINVRAGLDPLATDRVGELVETVAEKELIGIRRERTRGKLYIAAYSAPRALSNIDDLLQGVPSEASRSRIYKLQGLIDFEYQIIRRIMLRPGPEILDGGETLYKVLLARGLDEYATITRGDMFHVLGWLEDSILWNTRALQTWTEDDLDPPVQAMRALLIDLARVANVARYELDKEEALDWVRNGHLSSDQRFAIHEGLAQAEGELGNAKSAFAFQKQAELDLKQAGSEKQPTRDFQFMRLTLNLKSKFGRIDDELRAEARRKAEEAEEQGCLRFAIEIRRLIA